MQRLRIKFCRGEEVRFISHLDITRLWQRALRRAGVSLAYSEGFNPHPRMSFAAPLAVGVTSECELMDIVCSERVSPHWFASAVVSQQLPAGIKILQVYAITGPQPSLQSLVSYAEYRVEVQTEKRPEEIEAGLRSLLSAERLPWQHSRDTGIRGYDLRALIDNVWLVDYHAPYCTLGMKLRCDTGGSGRPEQVTAALGFEYPRSMHRTRLFLRTS